MALESTARAVWLNLFRFPSIPDAMHLRGHDPIDARMARAVHTSCGPAGGHISSGTPPIGSYAQARARLPEEGAGREAQGRLSSISGWERATMRAMPSCHRTSDGPMSSSM